VGRVKDREVEAVVVMPAMRRAVIVIVIVVAIVVPTFLVLDMSLPCAHWPAL
jgi:uncharacterized protein (DUF983 family)